MYRFDDSYLPDNKSLEECHAGQEKNEREFIFKTEGKTINHRTMRHILHMVFQLIMTCECRCK